MSIFDNLKIKIKYRGIDENPLAIVTLNLNGEAEIRFAPILWTKSKTAIFFTMPSLKEFHYQNSFVVIDKKVYSDLQKRIFEEFKIGAKEFYHPNEYKLIESVLNTEEGIPKDLPF